jgi:hypothetical protein
MEGQDPIVYFNVEKQVLVVAPMNHYMRLAEQIDVLVTKQIKVSNRTLKLLLTFVLLLKHQFVQLNSYIVSRVQPLMLVSPQ